MEQLKRVLRVFYAPEAALAEVIRAERALLALVLLVAAAWGAHWAHSIRIDAPAMERQVAKSLRMMKGSEVSDSEVSEEAQRRINMRRIGGYAKIAIITPLATALAALPLWLLLAGWRGGPGYRGTFRLTAHLALPLALRSLMAIPIILSYPSIAPDAQGPLFKTDLASLLDGPALLRIFDPFWIWMALLAGVATASLGRGKWHALAVGLCCWIALGAAAPWIAQ